MKRRPNFDLPEMLVFLIQNTQDELFDKLLELCEPILYSAIRKYYLVGYEEDDFIQEGRVILTKAVDDYDFGSKMGFLAYYQMMLMNHLHKLLRKQYAQSRRANKGAYSLEELTENLGIHIQGNSAVETNPENAFLLSEAYSEYSNGLSKLEKFVFDEYMSGKTVDEIVQSSKYNKIQITDALYRCRRKLNERLQ